MVIFFLVSAFDRGRGNCEEIWRKSSCFVKRNRPTIAVNSPGPEKTVVSWENLGAKRIVSFRGFCVILFFW